MFFKQDNEQKLKELLHQNERLNAQIEELLKELQIKPEQLTAFISDSSNFTDKNWNELQELQKKLEEDLQKQLENVPDPLKTRKTRENLNPQLHWIPVR